MCQLAGNQTVIGNPIKVWRERSHSPPGTSMHLHHKSSLLTSKITPAPQFRDHTMTLWWVVYGMPNRSRIGWTFTTQSQIQCREHTWTSGFEDCGGTATKPSDVLVENEGEKFARRQRDQKSQCYHSKYLSRGSPHSCAKWKLATLERKSTCTRE